MHISRSSRHSEYGFGHIGIILAVAAVLAVGGLVAWRFMGAQKNDSTSTASTSLAEQIANAKCDYDDKDLCKFFTSWKAHDSYKMESKMTDKTSGEVQTASYTIDGDKTYSKSSGSFTMEMITEGELTTYTRSSEGTWWKKTYPKSEEPAVQTNQPELKLDEPDGKTADPAVKEPTYKPLGKEACGNLTCFKYQVVYPDAADTTEYIWFDTKDYQLRRTVSDAADSTSETTFSYDNVSVKIPDHKVLGPDQIIIPGEAQPQTIPSFQ